MHAQVFSWCRCELVGGIGRFQSAEITEENTEIMDSEMEGQNIETHHESALLKIDAPWSWSIVAESEASNTLLFAFKR